MKINRSNYLHFINQLYKKNIDNKYEKRKETSSSKDSIELTQTSKDIKTYIDKMKEIDTGNKEKIQELKQNLSSGTYQVSSKELSRLILDRLNKQTNKGED